jgi:ribonuclease P protein component
MSYRYPKSEKLKSQILIERLFSEGQTVSKYPLRLIYLPVATLDKAALQMGVGVSKKHFKKAVDRNRYKRLLRECYRLHKNELIPVLNQPYIMMLLYQSKEEMSFVAMEQKMIDLIEKFKHRLDENHNKV